MGRVASAVGGDGKAIGAGMTATTDVDSGPLVHSALFYRDEREYVEGIMPFIVGGLEQSQPVLIAVPPNNLALLAEALGTASAAVTMADMTDVGRNPCRILDEVLGAFAAEHFDRPVRMVGEPLWPGRSADDYPVCMQHEASINVAFEDREAAVLCPYDASRLGEDVLADARTTHPLLWEQGATDRNVDYAPDEAWARSHLPMSSNTLAVFYAVRRWPI